MDGIGGIYGEGRARLSAVVAGLGAEDGDTRVPSCPAWTVRDVIAHLAGCCADVASGNMEGFSTEAWADAQVRQRRQSTMAELVGEWSTIGPRLEAVAHRFPPRMGRIWVLDLTAHEHDVRGALCRPGARDSRGIDMGLGLLVEEGLHSQLSEMSLGPLAVRTTRKSWVVGSGSSAAVDPVASLDATSFELFRALTGRRSVDQITRMEWSVDPGPFLPAFQFGTFTTSPADIVE